MDTETSQKVFQCPHCAFSSTRSFDLACHRRLHEVQKFLCKNCDASYLTRYGVTKHLENCDGKFSGEAAIELIITNPADEPLEDLETESSAKDDKDPVAKDFEANLLDSLRAIVDFDEEENKIEEEETSSSIRRRSSRNSLPAKKEEGNW